MSPENERLWDAATSQQPPQLVTAGQASLDLVPEDVLSLGSLDVDNVSAVFPRRY
jgi:hypothetical protein